MKHVEVTSSHIHSIGHEGNIMEVTYKAKGGIGATYAHTPISAEDHATIMDRHLNKGESIGRIIRNLEPKGVRLGD